MLMTLSSVTNPWDPFEQYREWSQYERASGYNSENYLARIANVKSNSMTDEEIALEIERAIDEILSCNPTGLYCKVWKASEKSELVKETKANNDFNLDLIATN